MRLNNIVTLIKCDPNVRLYYVLSFFHRICGITTKRNFDLLIRNVKRLNYAKIDLRFLLNFRKYDIVPKHLTNCLKRLENVFFHSSWAKRKVQSHKAYILKSLLNTEITDINFHIKFLLKNIESIKNNLLNSTSELFVDTFYSFLNSKFDLNTCQKAEIITNKFQKITNNTNLNQNNMNLNHNSIDSANENVNKWLINLTKNSLPDYVENVLSLGEKFNFCPQTDKKSVLHIYKNLENFIQMNELPDVDLVREKIVHCIIKDGKNKKHLTSFEKNLQYNIKKTRTFLRHNKDLLITRADKGNATVIINNNTYINKVELQLNDTKYYSKLPKNPISKLRNCTKHYNQYVE